MSDKYELEREYYKNLWVHGRRYRHDNDDVVPFMDWNGAGLPDNIRWQFCESFCRVVAGNIVGGHKYAHEYWRVKRNANGELSETDESLFDEYVYTDVTVEMLDACFTDWFFRMIRVYIVYCDEALNKYYKYYGFRERERFMQTCLERCKNVRAEDFVFFKGLAMSEVMEMLQESYEVMFEYVREHSIDPEAVFKTSGIPDYLPAKVFAYVHWLYNHDDGMILLPV